MKNGSKIHRADILIDKTVIEFQHSPISAAEFEDRNEFFRSCGFRIAWVFDVSEAFIDGRIYPSEKNQNVYCWLNPMRVFAAGAPIDDKSFGYSVWFYWADDYDEGDYLTKVVWTAKDDNGNPSLKRFVLANYPIHLEESDTGNIPADWFFENKEDYFKSALAELKSKYKYTVKYSGEKGKKRTDYICPLRPKEFGIRIYGSRSCSYCRYCYMLVEKRRDGKSKFASYCCYPNQVNKVCNDDEEYECSVPLYKI